MLRFLKKRWKSRKSSKKSIPLETPTHQTTKTGAECGGGSDGEYLSREISELMRPMGTTPDTSHGRGSRIATEDRGTGDQQPPAPNASIQIPGHESGDGSECSQLLPVAVGVDVYLFPLPIAPQGRGHTRGGSVGARSEQLDHSTPALRSDERDSNPRNRGEHEDRGPGVQQPSGSAVEPTSDGGQDDGDADDVVQSGKSTGKSRCSGCAIVHIDRYH